LWFAGKGAIGEQVRLGAWGNKVYVPEIAQPRTIVGVAGEVKTRSVAEPARTTIYVPAAQLGDASTWWVVHGGGWNEAALRRAVQRINPEVGITNLEPYPAMVAHTLARPSFEA